MPESLRNYSRLLEKQSVKLNHLDSECMTNWDKCNRFYLSSREFSISFRKKSKLIEEI